MLKCHVCGKNILLDDDNIGKAVVEGRWSCTRYNQLLIHFSTKDKNKNMSHFLFGKPPVGYVWDHIDHNTHNMQRTNMRLATRSQNAANAKLSRRNTSGFKGVRFQAQNQNWYASIGVNRKEVYLGVFKTKEEAARAYDKKAVELFGEFASINFPQEKDQICKRTVSQPHTSLRELL